MEQTPDVPMSPMHPLSQAKSDSSAMKVLFILVLVGALGIGSGYLLSKATKHGSASSSGSMAANGSSVGKGTVIGSEDTKTFKDTTEGVEKEGGITGEGQYHLVRPGGDSQNVYLTSSLVDLSVFVNRKIKVWGQTNAAQHAGWLMDVGKVEVLE